MLFYRVALDLSKPPEQKLSTPGQELKAAFDERPSSGAVAPNPGALAAEGDAAGKSRQDYALILSSAC